MVAFTNVTIDDSSSLILYDPPAAWATSSADKAQGYANSTFHSTSVSGATAKLTFNGTGVWLYGATRPDYGSYIFVVDNVVSAYANATSAQPAFGQLLAGVGDLDMGTHVVTIMSGGPGPFDLDSIVYETVDQSQQGVPPPAGTAQKSSASTSTQSSRLSAQAHATAGPVDSGSATASPSSASPTAPPAAGDAPPQPTGDVPSTASAVPTRVAASPNAAPSTAASATALDSSQASGQAQRDSKPPAGTSQPKGGIPKGAIIGAIVGVAVLLLLVAVLLFVFMRRRRRARYGRGKTLPSPILPLQDPEKNRGYFFGGQGANSDQRARYLDAAQNRISQQSFESGSTLRGGGYDAPYQEKDITGMPTPLPPVFVRDSSYTAETNTLRGRDDDESDIADLYSRMDAGPPVRPPRPPELRLSV